MSRRRKKTNPNQQDERGPVSTPSPLPREVSPEGDSQRDRDDKQCDTYRSELVQMEQDTGREYDKWILTIAGIAFGFSISLVKDYIKPSGVALQCPGFLYWSWICFGFPVALILINLHLAYSAARKCREILDIRWDNYEEHQQDFFRGVAEEIKGITRIKFVEMFNLLSLISFLSGIILLTLFAWKNTEVKHGQTNQGSAVEGKNNPQHGNPTNPENATENPKATTTVATTTTADGKREIKESAMSQKPNQGGGEDRRSYTPHTPRPQPQPQPQQPQPQQPKK